MKTILQLILKDNFYVQIVSSKCAGKRLLHINNRQINLLSSESRQRDPCLSIAYFGESQSPNNEYPKIQCLRPLIFDKGPALKLGYACIFRETC